MNPETASETKILIVEDEGIVALAIKVALGHMGYHVTGVAPSGEKALEMLELDPVNLVLMDIKLRGVLDGIETTRTIKETYDDIAVIYLSAHNDRETMARAWATNPAAFLLKPLADGMLKDAIEKVVFD